MIDEATYEGIVQRLSSHAQEVLVEHGWDRWLRIKVNRFGFQHDTTTYLHLESREEFDAAFESSLHEHYFFDIPSRITLEEKVPDLAAWEIHRKRILSERPNLVLRIFLRIWNAVLKFRSLDPQFLALIPQINTVSIGNFYAIQEEQTIELDGTREVYFLGENGDGKTLLLLGIHLAFASRLIREYLNEEAGAALDLIAKLLPKDKSSPQLGKEADQIREDIHEGQNPPHLRGVGTNSGTFVFADEEIFDFLPNFFAYGANRNQCDAERYDKTGFMSLYISRTELYSPIALLKQAHVYALEHALNDQKPATEQRVIPKWLSPKKLEAMFSDLLEGKVTLETSHSGVRFKEKGAIVEFEKLSEGFKCTLIWVADLLFRLQTAMPLAGALEHYHAVVMVDEIELHLHPTWQATLVKKLRSYLPGIQFIFTTHSPAVIQGASDDARIFKVSRSATTGATTISAPYLKKDLNHMMFNTLMTSPLFGLESARISPTTENPDTSDSYLHSRVTKRVQERIHEMQQPGNRGLEESEIDVVIDEVLNLEWGA